MQDIQLGTLMALLPFFEGRAPGEDPTHPVVWLFQLLQVLFGLPALVLLGRSLATRVIGRVHRYVVASNQGVHIGMYSLATRVIGRVHRYVVPSNQGH